LLLASVLGLGGLLTATLQGKAGQRTETGGATLDAEITGEDVKPRWKEGDQWTVETLQRVLQSRNTKQRQVPPVRWHFKVGKSEQIDGDDCYKLEVTCLADGVKDTRPTKLWMNKKTLGLQQIDVQLPIQGQYKQVREKYKGQGHVAPVFVPVTAIPLDMPVFLPAGEKGLSEFTVRVSIPDEDGKKDLGDVGFRFRIKQNTKVPDADGIKGLIHEEFAKGLTAKKTLEFNFEGGHRQARQIWQEGQPWPLYSSNGPTTAKLIEFKPAD
jgi:hypothetical protein